MLPHNDYYITLHLRGLTVCVKISAFSELAELVSHAEKRMFNPLHLLYYRLINRTLRNYIY